MVKKNANLYPVDGEIGRFSFETYSAVNLYGEVLYNPAREFFCPLQGEEKYCTEGFKEIALIYVTDGVKMLNDRQRINVRRNRAMRDGHQHRKGSILAAP